MEVVEGLAEILIFPFKLFFSDLNIIIGKKNLLLPMSLTVLVFSYPNECSKWVILAFFHEWNIRGLFLVMPKWRNFIYFLFFTRHCEPGGLFFTKLSWFYMVFKAVVVFNWLLQTCMYLRSFARYLCLRARSPHSFGFCKVDSLIFLLS